MRRRPLVAGLVATLVVGLAAGLVATPLAAQEATAVPPPDGPWWWRIFVFVVSLPWTLYHVFVDGERMYLLPAPLLGTAACIWSFIEWRRQRFWTPRIIHVMAVLGLLTIIAINVSWVMAGGTMWTQRYVVIAIFGLFPYIAYLLFLGPRYLGRKRAPVYLDLPSLDAPSRVARPGVSPGEMSEEDARAYGLRRTYVWVGAAVAGLVVGAFTLSPAQSTPTSGGSPVLLGTEFQALDRPGSMEPGARGMERGDPNAPMAIIEFGDLQCPGCASFARRMLPEILGQYVDTGRAKFVFFDRPLPSVHEHTLEASQAAHCADDQGHYWQYQAELLSQQAQWSEIPDPTAAFVRYAMGLEMDRDAFRACMESDRHTDVVNANMILANRLRVNSTPTILIRAADGRVWDVPHRSFEQLSSAFEELEGGAGVEAAEGA